jgi:hypothetical protein
MWTGDRPLEEELEPDRTSDLGRAAATGTARYMEHEAWINAGSA